MMNVIVTGVVAGMLGTLIMDFLNHLFARIGMISKIDIGMIGRMAAGWAHGRFYYCHPDELEQVSNEVLYGYVAHYAIGVGLAIPYLLGWNLLIGGTASPVWTIVYGVATTAGSWFFIFPSMGLGALGRLSPEGIRSPLSSLANHLFYGVGMAIGIALV
jgi:uncharacterized membrane protein YeaQ/YmgE (transglycosylase-associated protein family)